MTRNAFGLTFAAIGVILLFIAVFLFVRQKQFLAKARKAPGVVSAVRTTTDDDGGEMYAPIVDFRTETGAPATYKSTLYTRPSRYRQGVQVELLYDPDNPANAQIVGRPMNNAATWILAGLGLVFVIAGIAVLVIESPAQ